MNSLRDRCVLGRVLLCAENKSIKYELCFFLRGIKHITIKIFLKFRNCLLAKWQVRWWEEEGWRSTRACWWRQARRPANAWALLTSHLILFLALKYSKAGSPEPPSEARRADRMKTLKMDVCLISFAYGLSMIQKWLAVFKLFFASIY